LNETNSLLFVSLNIDFIKCVPFSSIEIVESSQKIYYHSDINDYITYRKTLIKHNLMNSITIKSFVKKFITMIDGVNGCINNLDCFG